MKLIIRQLARTYIVLADFTRADAVTWRRFASALPAPRSRAAGFLQRRVPIIALDETIRLRHSVLKTAMAHDPSARYPARAICPAPIGA
jgi:hypothetical protein